VAAAVSNFFDAHRLLRMIYALGLVVTVAAGCGVPGSGEPVVLDNAPGAGGPAAPTENVDLPEPERGITASALVEKYLQVGAAADWTPDLLKDERIAAAQALARSFLSQTGKDTWAAAPGGSVDVIAVTSIEQKSFDTVTVAYRRVGTLEADGTITPVGGSATFTFKIAQLGATGPLLLDSAPPNLLPLSLDGLRTLFQVRPIYFWSRTTQSLVPDRRYLSRHVSAAKRVKTIVDRVLAGPSDSIAAAVIDRPATASLGNAELNGNNVVVNLPVTEQTNQDDLLRRLASQLRWSLHPDRYSVELQVGGRRERTYSDTDYEADNWSLPQTSLNRNELRLFGAVDGKVVPLDREARAPSILALPENVNVVAAALNVKQNSAALVRSGGGKQQLWVGRPPAAQAAPQFRPASFPSLAIAPSTFSRPSYLPGAGARVLIVGDGHLYDVDLGSGVASEVTVPPNIGSPVGVSVAPDGARIAIVTAAKAWVATIDSSKTPAAIGTDADSMREVYVGEQPSLQAVGWYYEHQIVVGGRFGGGSALIVAAIDGGALATVAAENLIGTQITQLSAVPRDPAGEDSAGSLVIETVASQSSPPLAYQTFVSGGLEQIRPPSSGSSPSPSGSGSGGSTQPPRVTAAFYADVI
jgi:hypothetical protein